MRLKDLIGFRLISISNEEIIVEKDGKQYRLEIDDDYGDCCGWNEIEAKLLVSETDLVANPVITNVEVHGSLDENFEYSSGKATFFGVYKPMATLETSSGSGSGWQYGAAVTVMCKELSINETISSW